MKHVLRYTAFAIVCLIVLSSTLVHIAPTSQAKPDAPEGSTFLQKCWAMLLGFKWYNIGSGPAPKYFYADPDHVEINYLGNVTVNLTWGVEDSERNPWHRFNSNTTKEFTIIYDIVFPEGMPKDAFHAVFDPPIFDVLEYDRKVGGTSAHALQPTTKLTLFLDLSPDPSNPIQDFILDINVTMVRQYGDLITYLSGSPDDPNLTTSKMPLPLLKIKNIITMLFGRYLSATLLAETKPYRYNVSLFVKVNPFRNAELYVPSLVNMHLNDCRTAQIQVQNRGSHIEQFGFRVNGEDDSLLVNTPSPVTLAPGEIGYVGVGLVTKPIAYDRGTLHSVSVEVYPCDQPNVTLSSGILSVRTKGFVVSNVPTIGYFWHIFFAGLIIFFFVILILINRRRKLARICKKPEKPWKHYNERGYLESLLKEKKLKEYKRTLEMMKEEYNSALLWYKGYRNFLIKERRKQVKLKKLLSGTSSRGSNVSKKTEQEPVVQPGAKEQKIKPKAIRAKPKEITRDDGREKTLQKIRRQQQKQKKKLGI